MLDKSGEGVLNDWDHGLKLDHDQQGSHQRTVRNPQIAAAFILTFVTGDLAIFVHRIGKEFGQNPGRH